MHSDIIVFVQVETGKSIEECRKQIFMIDSKGLVCKSRLRELQHHKVNFAHDTGDTEWVCESLPLQPHLVVASIIIL